MARVTVKMSSAGARQLMNSAEVQQLLLEHARDVAARAGEGFDSDVQPGRNRAHAMVKSTDYESMRRQATDNVLLKAIGGGG